MNYAMSSKQGAVHQLRYDFLREYKLFNSLLIYLYSALSLNTSLEKLIYLEIKLN